MIKSLIQLAVDAITKYKAHRAKAVVTEYIAVADVVVPAALSFYRSAAHIVIDKTFENPEPALKLMHAIQGVVDHYGPALSAEFEDFKHAIDGEGASPLLVQRLDALGKAVADLLSDIK